MFKSDASTKLKYIFADVQNIFYRKLVTGSKQVIYFFFILIFINQFIVFFPVVCQRFFILKKKLFQIQNS